MAKQHKCPDCGRLFRNAHGLAVHRSLAHRAKLEEALAAGKGRRAKAELSVNLSPAIEELRRARALIEEVFDGLDRLLGEAKALRLVCLKRTDALRKLKVDVESIRLAAGTPRHPKKQTDAD